MITRAQQILLKRAQAQAGLDDADYRDAIEAVSGIPGCRSSKDSRLTDRHIDTSAQVSGLVQSGHQRRAAALADD